MFTYASTRAVHLELALNLTEEYFILAFSSFASRKSLPRITVSHNATTFCNASNHIHQLCQSNSSRENSGNLRTDWKFIPKRAPWFGGWCELLIGLTKTSVKKSLGQPYLSYEKLQSVVSAIEAILNDGPSTFISTDSSDPEALTPSNQLYGQRIVCLPYQDVPDDSLNDLILGSQSSLKMRSIRSCRCRLREIPWNQTTNVY